MFLSRNIIETQRRNPSNADRSRLQPAYDRINTAVRQFDEDVLIFFAGVTWDDVGPGFTAPPGGDDFANRSVLAYHYYEPPQADTTAQVDLQRAGARRLGTGLFMTEVWRPLRSFLAFVLTEIYLCDACSCQEKILRRNGRGQTGGGRLGGVDLFDAADAGLQSWSYWELKSFCREDNATLRGSSQNSLWSACKTGIGPAVPDGRTCVPCRPRSTSSVF
jgi:hypothetical protein